MELYVYGIAAFVALVVTATGFFAVRSERRRYKVIERRLRRPF